MGSGPHPDIAMTPVSLRPDCARCAALCCVALAFDHSTLFGFDKAAGEPCANLSACGRCTIHADLPARGFGGCVAYDCLGAGPAVTQGLFDGRTWQDDPALLPPMMAAFAALRPAHDLLALLGQAQAMALPAAHMEGLEAARAALDPPGGWTPADVAEGRVADAVEAARAALRALGPVVRVPAPRTPHPPVASR
jgi:hypothetical protein